MSARFWALLIAEPLAGADVLDVGTGRGRLALALAPRCRRIVGIDRDPALVAEAARRAAAAGLANAVFRVADADAVEYEPLLGGRPALVTAHLFLSDAFVERAARALAPGGAVAFAGLHVDQWRETGRPSRFAYDESRAREVVTRAGLTLEHVEVEREVEHFASAEAALGATRDLQARWAADGRWAAWVDFLRAGGRTLTRSHVIVKARRELAC